METPNIITTPDMKPGKKRGGFWKQLGMLVLGTTISIVLTFGTAQILDSVQRAKDRRLTALMVMSNVEAYAEQLDSVYVQMAAADSAIAWLISKPLDELEKMPNDMMIELLKKAHYRQEFTYDKSAEKIFSNSIDTWKNMGNFQFIDNVGVCFSKMEAWDKQLNEYVYDLNVDMHNVSDHAEQYPGTTLSMKKIRDVKIRTQLRRLHNYRTWLLDCAKELRWLNRNNMTAIGISEQELTEFIEKRHQGIHSDEENPTLTRTEFPALEPSTLTTFSEYDIILDSIMANK